MPVAAQQPTLTFRRASDQTAVWYLGAHVQTRLAGADTGGGVAVLDHTAHRGYHSPVYRNTRATETFLVRSGEVLVSDGRSDQLLTAGAVVHVPLGSAHGFVVVSVDAQLTTIHEPAGFEVFQEAVGTTAPVDTHGVPPTPEGLQTLPVTTIAALAAQHGLEITGPPPALPSVQ